MYNDVNQVCNIPLLKGFRILFYSHRNEEPNYNYGTGRPWSSNPNGVIGHFTQLVWKGTTKLGVGIAGNRSKNCRFVVFQYQPQGNVQGIYTENVFKP